MTKGKITPNNILHFNKKTPKEETTIKENKITLENILDHANTSNISDAIKNLYQTHGLIKNIKPITYKYKTAGYIRTIETNSDDWGTCIKGIYEAQPDEILFIKCSNEDYAVWGELASTAAKTHGIRAAVIYGASRDTEDILKLDFPVFSTKTVSAAGLALNKGTISENILLDERIIRTGDFIVADADGTIIIPQENLEEVITELNNIKEFEEKIILELFDENKQLDEILGL